MADTMENDKEDEKINETPPLQTNQDGNKLVKTAIEFLQNPKVVARPLEQKKKFLKQKGLTDEQIDEAIRGAGYSFQQLPLQHHPNYPPQPMYMQPAPLPFWMRFRDSSFAVIVLFSTGYGLYKLYLTYVKPYLFEKEESKLDTSLKLLIETMQNVQQTLNSMQEKLKELATIAQSNQSFQKFKEMEYINDLKTEINSIKGLLLNRRSFPPPPNLTNGLPSWQMLQMSEANNGSTLTDELKDESEEDKLQASNSSQSI